ncbi:hypothetical protein TRVA0_002S01552 [Trichomonascus vanleenenianus]|uniref:uncharacterized protein n=1 Tax=Trichomonascus vanleenenianus TaxID=2268995 RepID=UPI003ECA4F00
MDPAEREKVELEEKIRDNNFQIKFRIHQIEDQLSRSSNDTLLSHEVSKLKDQLEFTDISLQKLKGSSDRPLIDAEKEYTEAKLKLDNIVRQVTKPEVSDAQPNNAMLSNINNGLLNHNNGVLNRGRTLNGIGGTKVFREPLKENPRIGEPPKENQKNGEPLKENPGNGEPLKELPAGLQHRDNDTAPVIGLERLAVTKSDNTVPVNKPRFMTFGQFRALGNPRANPLTSNKENEPRNDNLPENDKNAPTNEPKPNQIHKGKQPLNEFEPANDLISMESFDVNTPIKPVSKFSDPLKQLNGTVEHLTPDSILAPGQAPKRPLEASTTAFFDPFSDASDALCQSLVNETKSLKKELDTLKRKMANERQRQQNPVESVQTQLEQLYSRIDGLSITEIKSELGQLIHQEQSNTPLPPSSSSNLSAESQIAIYKYGIQRLRTKRNDLLFCNHFKSKELESYRNASRKRLKLLQSLGIIKILDEQKAFSTVRPKPTLKATALAIRAAIRIQKRLAASRESAVALRHFVKSNV